MLINYLGFRFSSLIVATMVTAVTMLFWGTQNSCAQSGPRPNVDYVITWIETGDPNYYTTLPSSISDRGDAVGWAWGKGLPNKGWVFTNEVGFLWANDIAILPPGYESAVLETCRDISNNRVIVGNARINGLLYPYKLSLVLDETTLEPIPQPVVFLNISGTVDSITEAGDIVSTGYVSSTNSVRWQINRPIPNSDQFSVYIATLYGISYGGANYSAQLVTGAKTTDRDRVQRTYGFQYTASTGKTVKFPGFVTPGTNDITVSFATSINDSGKSVGGALFKQATATAAGLRHAALFNGTSKPTDLGVLPGNLESTANAINNANQVVGVSGPDAFFWTSTSKMYNLDALVIPDLEWATASTIQANKINSPTAPASFGEILGTAKFENGDGTFFQRAFLLTPIQN